MNGCLKVLIGIFMYAKHNTMQKKWNQLVSFGSGPIICGLNFRRVYAGRGLHEINGSIIVPAIEGINQGKTFAWFEYASTSGADYVFKMDTDTAINPVGLHRTILDAAIDAADYIGFAMTFHTCGRHRHCPLPGANWTYMSGAFYGMKATVSKQVVKNSWVRHHISGIEDLLVGRWIYKVIKNPTIYNITCIYTKDVECPIRHFQKNKYKAPKKWLTYGRSLSEKPVALSFHFKAGLVNQLISFQKTACKALSANTELLEPTIFNCDKTTFKDTCNTSETFRLSSIFVVSRRVRNITVTNARRVETLQNPFYMKDCCHVTADRLPDILDVVPNIKHYGKLLMKSLNITDNKYVCVQFRAGEDWERHNNYFKDAYVSPTRIARQLGHLSLPCILLTPESTNITIHVPSCKRVKHDTKVHPIIRLVSEYYLASRSKVFHYNMRSTMQHVVRRLAKFTKLVPLHITHEVMND
jgi:hypothetical protein